MSECKRSGKGMGILLAAVAIVTATADARADINVTQSRYDLYRTGANPEETILNTSNVNVKDFGLLYSYPVDGDIYAQPLYVSNLRQLPIINIPLLANCI